MPNDPEHLVGWKLREALRRTVDPDMLMGCMSAIRDWRRAGALSESLSYGAKRVGGSAVDRKLRQIFELRRTSTLKVESDFRNQLSSGRLIAWGRRGGPVVELKPIPRSAWDALRIKNYRRSIVVEWTAAKTPIFDVRIYPVIEAPDAIDHLANQTLIDAFQRFVFGDSQWMALCKRAKANGGHPLELGHQLQLYKAVWPVDCGKGDWDSRLRYIQAPRRTKSDQASHLADLVLGRRFARLIGYLAAGELVAEGVTTTGQTEVIPRSIWVRERTHLDLNNGDMLEYQPDAGGLADCFSRRIYVALMLRKPGIPTHEFHVKGLAPDGARPFTIEPKLASKKRSLITAEAREVAREECAAWLGGIMRASPDERTESKASLWEKAQQKWPWESLARRSFDDAWSDAIKDSGTIAWSAPGAPKKSTA